MRLLRILFAFDVFGLLVLAYFFVDGRRYSTAGGDYMEVWTPLLLVPGAVLAGGWVLHGKGKAGAANVLLGVLAAPFV